MKTEALEALIEKAEERAFNETLGTAMAKAARQELEAIKNGRDDLWIAERIGDEVHVTLVYPRSEGEANAIQVGLSEVRAADNIRISYDFERDGWKIEQPSNHGPWGADEEPDEGWREVAFVKSWALNQPG